MRSICLMEPDLPMTIAYSEHQLTLDTARTDDFLGTIADRYRDETVRMNKERSSSGI